MIGTIFDWLTTTPAWGVIASLVSFIWHADADDKIRWSWVALTAFGSPYALWNLREVSVDNWAIAHRVNVPRFVSLWTAADLSVQTYVFIALAMELSAGICALRGFAVGALCCLFVSALSLVVLSYRYTQDRRAVNREIHAVEDKKTWTITPSK